ncbi:MAG: lysophospholipid acyltransferase family protein, partial [Acetanaerobacterium sp.]
TGAYRVKKKINYMAKEELINIPLIGRILRRLGAFPVRRGKGDRGALDMAASIVNEGKIVGIFPEGTRSATGKPLPAKSGVAVVSARTHCDVVPASIYIEGSALRWRTRVTVRFGKAIPFENLGLSEELAHTQLKAASAMIMQHVTELLELGTAVKA